MRKLLAFTLLVAVLAGCTSPAPAPAPTPPSPAPVATATPAPTKPAAPAPTDTPQQQPSPTPLPPPTPAPSVTAEPGTLIVDPAIELGPISPLVFGTNYGPWVSLRPETMDEATNSGITIMRWPGGEWGDANDATPFLLDMYIDIAKMIGAEPYIHVRFIKSTPEKAAEMVRFVNKEMGYNVKYWSIGNEPSLYEKRVDPAENTWDAEAFSKEWRRFAEAMRAVDPSITLIGPEIHQWTGTPAVDVKDSSGRDWLRTFLKYNGDLVDIVAIHRYPFPNNAERRSATIAELRADAPEWTQIVRNLRKTIREETGRDLPVGITEFNSHWSKAVSGEATPDSFYNAIWLGDVLGRLITEKVDLATQFLLVSGADGSGFGLLSPYSPRPSYFTYLLYKQFGRELVASASGVPDVTIYAAQRADGTLTVMMINLGDTEARTVLRIVGREGDGPAEVYVLDKDHSAARLDDINVGSQTKVALPGQSMTLWVIAPAGTPAEAPAGAPAGDGQRPKEVHAWAPYFTALEKMTLEQNKDLIKELNFVWYQLEADGKISGVMQSPQGVGVARAYGMRVVPSIQNGGFDPKRVGAIVNDPAKRQAHIKDIVDIVLSNRYDGIDIDYESLHAADRDSFSTFIEELAAALHANGKLLSVTVHPKTDENGTWEGPRAQDWARLGKAADEFKIMVYDYSSGASKAGEIAPLGWAGDVLTYAATLVPPEKTFLGIPLYGYDWTGSAGQARDWIQATKTARQQDAEIKRSDSNEAWFTYGGGTNTVYFNDALTMKTRLERLAAEHPDVAGIALWRLGNEDPANWTEIRNAFAP